MKRVKLIYRGFLVGPDACRSCLKQFLLEQFCDYGILKQPDVGMPVGLDW